MIEETIINDENLINKIETLSKLLHVERILYTPPSTEEDPNPAERAIIRNAVDLNQEEQMLVKKKIMIYVKKLSI